MKFKRFRDIPKFPVATYEADVPWKYLREWLEFQNTQIMKLDLDPFYQRDYVWTEAQKIAYVEFILRGGVSGKDLYWNCPTWMNFKNEPSSNILEIVDGKQRLNAVTEFLSNKIKVFGSFYDEFEDSIPLEAGFKMHIAKLQSKAEVVEWYLGLNQGGSIHTKKDLEPAISYLLNLLGVKNVKTRLFPFYTRG